MQYQQLLSKKILADVLSVESVSEGTPYSKGWIRAQLRAGRLRGRKLGGRWIILRPALLEFLRADPPLRMLPDQRDTRPNGGDS